MLTCGLTWSNAATISGATMSDPVVDALRLGKAMEREAIVAWLRDPENTVHTGAAMAAYIELGEHLAGDDE